MKVKDLQGELYKFFSGNPKLSKMMNYAEVFVYIYLGFSIIDIFNIHYPFSIIMRSLMPISFYLFVAGAVMSFAKNKFFSVAVLYGVRCLDRVIYMIRYSFSLPLCVNILIYAAITYAIFKLYLYTSTSSVDVGMKARQSNGYDISTNSYSKVNNEYSGVNESYNSANNYAETSGYQYSKDFESFHMPTPQSLDNAEKKAFCPNCGNGVENSDVFCEKCGTRLQ